METHSPLPNTSVSASTLPANLDSSDLIFPTLDHDQKLASWADNSHPAPVMSAPSETHSDNQSNLGDSTYEFIDTDTESRDDNATESVASTDDNGADDVESLADTEGSDEDSEDERNRAMSPIPTYTGLDGSVHTPTIGHSTADFLEELDRPLPGSIEFEEPFNLGAENVSVKHTMRELNEAQTALVANTMNLKSPPTRLVATIRQTMTKQGLSTKEPLRILYVGSHSAKQDIIYKIASSVAASVSNDSRITSSRNSQLFNIVPVSAFGSEKTPEVELMHSSGCQINVEDCLRTEHLKFEDEPEKPDVIKLFTDDNIAYHSVPAGSHFTVEPAWELPHIAIFYCSDTDTVDAKRTRTFAKTFMGRHKVPSIVISHLQFLEKSFGCMVLDQHALHMCLESRDPNSTRNIIHQRLPIDLASFLNIDAIQMNRNLAYLTGLHEAAEKVPSPASAKNLQRNQVDFADVEKASSPLSDSVQFIRSRSRGQLVSALLPLSMIILGFLFSGMVSSIIRPAAVPTVRINGNLASTVPVSTSSSTAPAPTSFLSTSLSTSTSLRTSTKTITVTHAHSMGPNSLSVIPKMELGNIAEKSQKPISTEKQDEKTLCTAEVLGDREILIRVPTSTLTSWLGKEAMSLNVSRGKDTVETERAYSCDEGIILRFPRKEAYGIMNISIITTKKPKINETFEVDFGSNWKHGFEDSFDKLYNFASDKAQVLENFTHANAANLWSFTQRALGEAYSMANSTKAGFENVQRQAASTRKQIKLVANIVTQKIEEQRAALVPKLEEFKEKLEQEQRQALNVPEQVQDAILKAQVESKLWWLKMMGRMDEYRQYQQAAAKAAKLKAVQYSKKNRVEKDAKGRQGRTCNKAKKEKKTAMKAGQKCSKNGGCS